MSFDHYQRENSTKNGYLYNQGASDKKFNTERVVELDLNVDQSKYRTLDYITGRWWQVDPKADAGGQESWSTYQFGFDNPIRYNDPEGDCIPFCGLISKYTALVASFSTPSSQGAMGRLATNRSGSTEQKAGMQNSAGPEANKAIATISDSKTVAETTAKNTKTATNEVSKDVLQTAQTAGTVMEFTPLAPIGAGINKAAGALDEVRQVALEDKPVADAATDVVVGVAIDKSVSTWGNAARSVAGGDNVVISTYESSASNFFQWVADKVTSYLRDDNKEKK